LPHFCRHIFLTHFWNICRHIFDTFLKHLPSHFWYIFATFAATLWHICCQLQYRISSEIFLPLW
jgi:hypothetical protein